MPATLCAQTPSEASEDKPQTIRETVTVTAPAPPEPPQQAGLRHVVEARMVIGLPLNGRNFMALATLAPGVALPPGSTFPRINGGRPRTNEYLFDGISVLQPEPGQVAFLPVLDAIEAFTIESNSPAAEFGRFNGGVTIFMRPVYCSPRDPFKACVESDAPSVFPLRVFVALLS